MRTLKLAIACAAVVVAALLIALMLVPAEVWHQAETDAAYSGFDSQLIYSKETGPSQVPGQVEVSPDALEITALPGSQPVAQLATTPFDRVHIDTNVRILDNPGGTTPLRIGIWSPRAAAGYFLTFTGGDSQVVSEALSNGTAGSVLLGGTAVRREELGAYSLDRDQRLSFSMDKIAGVMTFQLTSSESPPSGHPMLRLAGGPSDPSYHDIVSEMVPVIPNQSYTFAGSVKAVQGKDAYKISLEWLDGNKKHIGFESDWSRIRFLTAREWTEQTFDALAPSNARFARMYLGAGNGTRLLFADLSLRRAGAAVDLLGDGDLLQGARGWSSVGGSSVESNIIRPEPVTLVSTLTREQLPELFESRRLTFSASASSSGGTAAAVLDNYTLSLPHQRFYGVRLSDPVPQTALATLLALGGLLVVAQMAFAGPAALRAVGRRLAAGFTVRLTSTALWIGLAAALSLAVNVALMGLGSHPFDMTAEKTWSYIILHNGFDDIYYLPNLVPLAKVWNGGPWHEAVFPYGAVMGWFFGAAGLADRLFLNGPGGLQADSYGMELTIKVFVMMFAVADAFLIYGTLKGVGASSRWSLIGACAFFFNPALWVSVSVWGQTHAATVTFLLFGIWCTVRGNAVGGWLGLGASALTRPQMLVPAALLALVLLRRHSFPKNLQGIAWTVIVLSLVLAPFTLTIGPSLPIDILRNQFYFQEAGGNEASQTVVSLSTYSVWPLATYLVEGVHGLDRFGFPAAAHFIGPFSYQRVSEMATLGALLLTGAAILFDRRTKEENGSFLVPLAFGTVSFFVLKTGLTATHCLIALPFIAMTVHRLKFRTWMPLLVIWSITTLVPMFGGLGLALEDVEHLAPLLHSSNNPITWLSIQLVRSDWFINAGILANLVVFGWLAYETFLRRAHDQLPERRLTFETRWRRSSAR